jgi:hypothetical protein
MHAVSVQVNVDSSQVELARKLLREVTVPRAKALAGFRNGTWSPGLGRWSGNVRAAFRLRRSRQGGQGRNSLRWPPGGFPGDHGICRRFRGCSRSLTRRGRFSLPGSVRDFGRRSAAAIGHLHRAATARRRSDRTGRYRHGHACPPGDRPLPRVEVRGGRAVARAGARRAAKARARAAPVALLQYVRPGDPLTDRIRGLTSVPAGL